MGKLSFREVKGFAQVTWPKMGKSGIDPKLICFQDSPVLGETRSDKEGDRRGPIEKSQRPLIEGLCDPC